MEGFIDSSGDKQGTFYYDLRVRKPSEIPADACVIISARDFTKMASKLLEMTNSDRIRIYVDYANALFYSKNPLEHEQLVDMWGE